MDALAQKKIGEAKQHIADAEKSMKTSLFKRKPDLESAANSYAQAGSCFRVAKEFKQAIDSCSKSAECYTQNNALFSAAKQHEQIALMANEIKNYGLLADSIQKAAELMITSGTRDSAGNLLERGANMLKLNEPQKSLQLYKRALQIAEVEEKYHEMVTYNENMISLALRSNQYNEALSVINDAYSVLDRVGSPEQYNKYIVTAMLIYMSRDDWVGAKTYLNNMRQRYQMQEGSTLDELLQAFDEKDDAKFKDLTKRFIANAVDNEALKIAQNIVKSEEWLKAQEQNKPKRVSEPVLPPVQPMPELDDTDKYNEFDLEPDGCKVRNDDHHHPVDADFRGPFINDDSESVEKKSTSELEPDGLKTKVDDHHQRDLYAAAQKKQEEDEFEDGIL